MAKIVARRLQIAYPLALLLIRWDFDLIALSFAERSLLVFLSLFFLAPCACCPLSLSPVSTVIWLECHWILLCGAWVDFALGSLIYMLVRVFTCPCYWTAG